MQVLGDDGLIEPEFLFKIRLVGGIDISCGVKQDIDDVAWNDAQQHKDDD